MRRRGLDHDAGYQVYVPLAQSPPGGMTLVIRTTNPEPVALTNSLRETVRAADSEAVVWVALGILVGAGGCGLTATALRSVAYGAGPFDPPAIGLAALVLLTVTIGACAAPVRQALRVDPVRCLRGHS